MSRSWGRACSSTSPASTRLRSRFIPPSTSSSRRNLSGESIDLFSASTAAPPPSRRCWPSTARLCRSTAWRSAPTWSSWCSITSRRCARTRCRRGATPRPSTDTTGIIMPSVCPRNALLNWRWKPTPPARRREMSDAPALILPEKSRAIGNDLRRRLGADKVKDDFPTLTAYSVDASIYKLVPKAVVQAETEDDIAVTVAYAMAAGVPITPRAAGTNLTGSAVGAGIILDCGRMNRILELNVEEKWARVQPGLNLTEFNKKLEPHGLMFGPDPSSRDMCKLGGMLSNNSAGPHTLRYGSVKDHVHAIRP